MASGLSHRALAEALARMRKEKEERTKMQGEQEQLELDAAEEAKRRELAELEAKKKALLEKRARDEQELEQLKQQVRKEADAAEEERLLFALQRRMGEFAGNDDASLRHRLITEGWSESQVLDALKRRTIDQQLDAVRVHDAAFPHWREREELEAITRQNAAAQVVQYRRDPIEELRELGFSHYKNAEQHSPSELYGQQPTYARSPDEDKRSDVSDAVRKQLGLDNGYARH